MGKSVKRVTEYRMTAPIRCNTASTFSVEKKRSAIRPMKNGEIMLAKAVVPKTAPASVPVNLRVTVR